MFSEEKFDADHKSYCLANLVLFGSFGETKMVDPRWLPFKDMT